MWMVIAKRENCEKRVITMKWNRANDLARRALGQGWKVRVKTYFADVLVANEDGDFVVVATKVRPHEAAKFSREWLLRELRSGCVMWPHGIPLPKHWTVID